jgi:predicted DNA-binding transcriptional regulator AlpA
LLDALTIFLEEETVMEEIKKSYEDDIFITAAEAMRILKLKRSTFYEYNRQGYFQAIRLGHQLRFRRDNIINLGRNP